MVGCILAAGNFFKSRLEPGQLEPGQSTFGELSIGWLHLCFKFIKNFRPTLSELP
mgnify:CR=1 FL=1|jgi:hypothetical protein